MERPEFTGSDFQLKEDERSVGEDNEGDDDDNNKQLPDDYYAYSSKYLI